MTQALDEALQLIDRLYDEQMEDFLAAKPRFVELIKEITHWEESPVERLAEIFVQTLVANQGNSPNRIRCGCGSKPFGDDGEWLPEIESLR